MQMMMITFVGSYLCLIGVLPFVLILAEDNDDRQMPQVARCLVDFARSDSDQNQHIDSQEFTNLIIERDCQFILENDATTMVFRYMACTCQSYDTDTQCCDGDHPVLYRPDSEKKYPANYMLDVCAKLEDYCNRDTIHDTNNYTNATETPGITTEQPSSNQIDDESSKNATVPNFDKVSTQPVVPTTATNSGNDQDLNHNETISTNKHNGWIWGLSFVLVLVGMVGGYMIMYKWSTVRSFLQLQNHSQSATIAKGNIHGDAICINDCMPPTQDEEDSAEQSEPEVSMEDTTVGDEENGREMGHDTSTDDAAVAGVMSCGEDESQGSSTYQTGSIGTQQTPFSMAIDEEYRKNAGSGNSSHFFAYDFAGLVKSQHQRHSDPKESPTETSITATQIPNDGSTPIIEWAMYPVPSSPQTSSPRSPRSVPRGYR